MEDQIHIRVSLAVLLIDDFTEKVITGSGVRVWVTGAQKRLRKQEGFHVFLNLPGPMVHICAEGPCYCREERDLDLRLLKAFGPVVKIRMKPSQLYAFPSGVVRLNVELPKQCRCFIFCEKSSGSKKLLKDYEKGGQELFVFQGGKEELEGKTCCIKDKTGRYEFLRLGRLKDQEKGAYLLEQTLEHDYKKPGARLYPASILYAEEDRCFFVALKKESPAEEYTFVVEKAGKRWEKKIQLESEGKCQIDIREEFPSVFQ